MLAVHLNERISPDSYLTDTPPRFPHVLMRDHKLTELSMFGQPRYPRPTGQSRPAFCPWHAHWISSFSLCMPAASQPPPKAHQLPPIKPHQKRPSKSKLSRELRKPQLNSGAPDAQQLESGISSSQPRTFTKLPPGWSMRPVWLQQAGDPNSDLSVYRRDFRPEKYGRPFVYPPMRGAPSLLTEAGAASAEEGDKPLHSISRTSYARYDTGLVQSQKLANDKVAELTSRSMQLGSGGASWLRHPEPPNRLPPLLVSSNLATGNSARKCIED